MRSPTPKQRRFVEEYLIDLNATQAAIRAGYSKKTANEQGSRLLANVSVAAAVVEAQRARMERTEITQDMVLRELAVLGFTDMGTYLDLAGKHGAVLDWSALPEGATKAISEITQEIYTEGKGEDAGQVKRTKFKLYDKRAALVDIGRHLGMFKDRLELGADETMRDIMKAVDGRTRDLPRRG